MRSIIFHTCLIDIDIDIKLINIIKLHCILDFYSKNSKILIFFISEF